MSKPLSLSVDRESDHRQVVKRVHAKPVEHGDRDDARNPHGSPAAATRTQRCCVLTDPRRKKKIVGE